MKIKLNKVLVLVLVLALMSTTAFALPNNSNGRGTENAPGQLKKGDFNDMEGFSWAERYVERMAKKDVIKGVGNGAFMPGGTAKEIETLIMLIREKGWEEELDDDAILPEEYNGKKPGDWMVPYIDLAVEKGLITDVENFDPNFPTKRSKAAVYFVRAVGMEDEALDNMDLILEFNDFNSIPEEHVGYVYVAYQIGLIEGYPGNTFQANKAINRAELAAMMTRLDDEFETEFSYSLIGKIEEIDETDMQLTLLVKGNEKTYDISDVVDVYIDDAEATLDDLAVNMVVKVYIENDEIIEISFRTEDEFADMRYEGEIKDFTEDFDEITIEENSDEFTFDITSETAIHVDILENELIEEFVGLNAVVKTEATSTTATEIWVELNEVEGTLVDINYDDEDTDVIVSVDVELDDSTTETFIFFEDIKIYVDDVLENLTDDAIGHEVEMLLLGTDEVVKLEVSTEVDTEDLEELVEDAEELVEDNYTTGSWITFETALTEAGIVLDETYPTQDEVDDAYDNLEAAIDDLIATVTDLVVVDEDVVTDLDNTNLDITVAENTTVEELEDALESEFDATFTVLDESEGVSVADDVVVTETMVLEVTAEDTTTVVEFTIIIQ